MTSQSASSVRVYLTVFAALALLTALTVGISELHLARSAAVLMAVFIAGVKASLIVLFFMHLKFEKGWIHWALLTALFLVLVLIFLVLPDVGTSVLSSGVPSP